MQSINNIEKRALALELTSELAEQMRTICEDERERVRRSGRPKKEKQEKPMEMKDIFKSDFSETKLMGEEDKRSHKAEKYEEKKAKEEAKQAKEAEKKAKEEAKQAKEAEKQAKEAEKQAKAQIKKEKEEAKRQKLLDQLRKLEEPKPKKSSKKSPKKLSLEIPAEPMTPSTVANSNCSSPSQASSGDFGVTVEDVESLQNHEKTNADLFLAENVTAEKVQVEVQVETKKAKTEKKTEKKKLGKNSIPYIECEGGSYILRNNYIYSNTQLLGKLTEGVPTFYGSKLEPDEDDDEFKVVKIEFKNITIATATSRQLVESRSCLIDINCCLYDGDCDKIGKYCPLTDIITLCEEEEVDYDSYEDTD
jgi:hypothetical protein